MAARVSIMVLPNNPLTAPPQILLDQNGVWVDMMPDDQGTNAKDIHETKKDIDARFQEIMAAVEGGGQHTADSARLKSSTADNYHLLVTEKVREVLRKAADTSAGNDVPELLIHTHTYLEWIPWEMFHDEKEFLGLRFRIARLPITRQVPDVSAKTVTVQRVYNLLANNFLDPPQEALWQNTFNGILPPGSETKFPPPHPNLDSIVNARDADILHITCHGGLRDPNTADKGVYWTLDSQNVLPDSYEFRTNDFKIIGYDSKPLVFGNACASTDAGGGAGRKNGLLPGYGASFFARGALNFIGTFAPITKTLAVEFARVFYEKLLGMPGKPPLPIAEALWATKHHYRTVVKSADPSYLFYCLYGPPDTVFHP